MGRADRVAEAIRKEVSSIVQFELKDPRIGFVTITHAEITDDLRYAKIYYSILGTEKQKQDTIDALKTAIGFIRKLVAERIRLRFAPDIGFKLDKNIEYSVKICEELDRIKKEDELRKNKKSD